ncbi:class III signal peptide-containing protein [Thermococcus sp.]
MKRGAQAAIEYLFMLAAVLVLVLYAARVVLNGTKQMTNQINNYVKTVREQVLEGL